MAKGVMEAAGYTADNPMKVVINYNTSEGHKADCAGDLRHVG